MKKFIFAVSLCAALGCVLLPGCSKSKTPNVQSGLQATPDEIRSTSADEWFDRIGEKEAALGYAPNTSGNVLIQKARESAALKDDIIRKAGDIIDDPQQNSYRRWQSCYVLSHIGDKRGIPAISHAFTNEDSVVRGVAACALGAFDDSDVRATLEAAAKTEQNPDVQSWVKKALDGQFLPGKH
jgi:HEAT repeat protein